MLFESIHLVIFLFFFKQKTAYEMRISDWSSDVCSSDLPLGGKRIEGKELKIGYFAQHQLEQLRPDESPLQHMMRLDPQTREQDHRNYLGGFDFRGDMARSEERRVGKECVRTCKTRC